MKGELQNAKGAIIEKVLSIRGKLYLSTASIHLRSVYHPENNTPTSLSLNGNCIEDLQQVQSSQFFQKLVRVQMMSNKLVKCQFILFMLNTVSYAKK